MFAKTTVSHSQTAIVNVYQAGSLPPPSGLPPNAWISHVTVVITEPISTTNITGLRICTRGSSFLKLSISARLTISRWNSEIAWRSLGVARDLCATSGLSSGQAVEREVELEHVHARFAREAEPAGVGVLGDQPVDHAQREPALGGDAVRLDARVGR